MFLNNAKDRGQNHTRAFEVFVTVKALEDPKKPIPIFHVEPHSVIPDEDDGHTVFPSLYNLDDLCARGRKYLIAFEIRF
jgi:hypothetical protein